KVLEADREKLLVETLSHSLKSQKRLLRLSLATLPGWIRFGAKDVENEMDRHRLPLADCGGALFRGAAEGGRGRERGHSVRFEDFHRQDDRGLDPVRTPACRANSRGFTGEVESPRFGIPDPRIRPPPFSSQVLQGGVRRGRGGRGSDRVGRTGTQ